MKAILVILFVLLTAASVLAYSQADVAATIVSHTGGTTEPAILLFSGSSLILIGGAVRRFV
jgi:hypothetical protein